MAEDLAVDAEGAAGTQPNAYAAALFSLGWPGVGQLYSGRWRRAVAFILGLPVLALLAAVWLVTVPLAVANLLPALLLLGLQLVAIVDAARGARSAVRIGRPWYTQGLVCTALALSNVLLWAPAEVVAIRNTLIQAFSIPSGGMERTILIGDRLVVKRFAYGLHSPPSGEQWVRLAEPHRGDLIAFLFPEDRRTVFLKRVIGLPGETVEVREKTVLVDGKALDEPYAAFIEAPGNEEHGGRPAANRGTWGPETVPPGNFFVLGDNRDNSRDSRYWGYVPVEDILGQAGVVYFSVDHARGQPARVSPWTIRWSRLGQILR